MLMYNVIIIIIIFGGYCTTKGTLGNSQYVVGNSIDDAIVKAKGCTTLIQIGI